MGGGAASSLSAQPRLNGCPNCEGGCTNACATCRFCHRGDVQAEPRSQRSNSTASRRPTDSSLINAPAEVGNSIRMARSSWPNRSKAAVKTACSGRDLPCDPALSIKYAVQKLLLCIAAGVTPYFEGCIVKQRYL